MFLKLILIGVTISIIGNLALWKFYMCKKRLKFDVVIDLVEKKEITTTDAEHILNKLIKETKFYSYIVSITLSVNTCYIFVLPYIFCINFLNNSFLLILSILIEVLIFLTVPKSLFKQHEETCNTLDSVHEEYLLVLKELCTL